MDLKGLGKKQKEILDYLMNGCVIISVIDYINGTEKLHLEDEVSGDIHFDVPARVVISFLDRGLLEHTDLPSSLEVELTSFELKQNVKDFLINH